MSHQNNRERLSDHLQQGKITAEVANVQLVRSERFRIVHKLSRDVRKSLNAAVKRGELGHMKKDKLKPEVYFHPTFRYLAIEARNKEQSRKIKALKSTFCSQDV